MNSCMNSISYPFLYRTESSVWTFLGSWLICLRLFWEKKLHRLYMYFGSKKVYDYDWCVFDGAGTVCYCHDLWQVWSWVTTMLHRSVPTSCLSPCTTQTMPMRCLVSGECDWMCVMQAWLWQGSCVMQLWSISTCIQNFAVCSNLFLLPKTEILH